MTQAEASPAASRFYRRLITGMAAVFGFGTLFTNFVALVAPPEARHAGDPLWLLRFDLCMGVPYLAAAWGVGLRRDWAPFLVWTIATLHAGSASIAALSYVYDWGISGAALTGTLVREAFWVLIGLHLSSRR